MVYGIEEMIAAGVPRQLFDRLLFVRQGEMLHAYHGPHEGTYHAAALSTLGTLKVCPCAEQPAGPGQGGNTVDLGLLLTAALHDLAAAPTVAGTAHARRRWQMLGDLSHHVGHAGPAEDLLAGLRRDLAASLAHREAISADATHAWHLAAAVHLRPVQDEPEVVLPALLRWNPDRVRARGLTHALLTELVPALESGQAWSTLGTVALATARRELNLPGCGHPPLLLEQLRASVEDYLRDWRAALERVVADHTGPEVILAVVRLSSSGSTHQDLARLLAPTAVAVGPQERAVAARVPAVIAAALQRMMPGPDLVAGPAEPGDDTDTLTALVAVLEDGGRTRRADALAAARGIAAPAAG